MDKLFALGFVHSATANLLPPANSTWDFTFLANQGAANILYAFVFHRNEPDSANWQVRYIGHTRKTFGGRMTGYQFGHGRGVNNRIHEAVKAHLTAGGKVDVFVMPDHFGVKIFDLAVDIAAGLEYSLIAHYAAFNHRQGHPPLANRAGNPLQENVPVAILAQEAAEEMQAEEEDYVNPAQGGAAALPPPLPTFDYILGDAYWRLPSINVPVRHQGYFGTQGTQVRAQLDLGNGQWQPLTCLVNRAANPNGSPRLYFTGVDGQTLQDWKHANFQPGATVLVTITAANQIRLSLP